MNTYNEFLEAKTQLGGDHGFEPLWIPDSLFGFQSALVTWALRKERAVTLWSNPGEVVWTPFMGVGSEVYGAIINGRKGMGAELKPSYYRQAVKNCAAAKLAREQDEMPLLAGNDNAATT